MCGGSMILLEMPVWRLFFVRLAAHVFNRRKAWICADMRSADLMYRLGNACKN